MEPINLLRESFRKRKVGSPFCLGAAVSLIFLGVFLLSTSITPKLSPLLQIPSVGGWPFLFSTSPSSYTSPPPSSSPSSVEALQGGILNRSQEQNATVIAYVEENGPHLEVAGEEIVSEKKNRTPTQGPADLLSNGSSIFIEGSLLNKSHEKDFREGNMASSSAGNNENGSLSVPQISQDNSSTQAGGDYNLGEEPNLKGCDIFDGEWVRDDSKPYYPAGSCPYIDRDFNCHLNGRPDKEFVKWRWKPNGCEIPR